MQRIIFLLFILSHYTGLYAQNLDSIWKKSLEKFDTKDYHGVIEDMNRLTEAAPDFYSAVYNRGIARLYLEDQEGACADMQLAASMGMNEHKDYIHYVCDDEVNRDYFIKSYYKKTKVYPELGYRPAYTQADTLRGALRPERTCFDVFFYDLSVEIMPEQKKIKGVNQISFHVINTCRTIQIDLFDNLKIKNIFWNGQELPFSREYNAVFIQFPEDLHSGEDHVVSVSYYGKPVVAANPPWEGGFIWEHDQQQNHWSGVACEQLGASSWWPNKDHLSDKPDSMLITLIVPDGYQAISNGTLRNVDQSEKKTDRYTWYVSYPINNYNVTFYLGKYQTLYDTLIYGNNTLLLKYYVFPQNIEKAREHFKQTNEVLDFYIQTYGDFPFERDGFGLVESPYEGMEHQTAIAYGNEYENNGYRNDFYDYIIVHEAAHEWWGNSVTASDMADAWIHEGFATYSEYLFLEYKFDRTEYFYELNENTRYIYNIWPMVQHRNVNENSFISNDIYNKGAMMIHCLRCNLNNDSLFFKIIKDYAISRRYQAVTSADFISFVNQYTGKDYGPFFKKYLFDTDLPVFSYTYRKEKGNLIIRYKWKDVEDGFAMPVGIITNTKNTYRIAASTDWNEIRIPDASWFYFFNTWTGFENCPVNAYTYYRTKCENL